MVGRASIVGAAATHVGNVRDHNEDSHFIDCDLGLFLVCDGMGGHAAGEVASDLAIRALREQWGGEELHDVSEQWLERGTPEAKKRLLDTLRAGVIAAHDSIIAEADRDETKSGMGTTLVGAVIVGGELVFAHAGDSRAYLVRDGISMQLTEDHTLLARLLAAGIDVDVSGEGSRFRSMLTNALGIGDEVKVSTFVVPLADGDRFLLCSDGVSEYVPENEVGDVLTKQPSPARAAQRLIDLALERGGGDNATAVVIRVLEAGETPLPAEQRKKDDTAIHACPLWGRRMTPQQRLRALRIAIPRDHNFGEKLPPHALGDRVAWIILEGELVQDGEPVGPGALVYPESLLSTREALPPPPRDALAITRSDVRALAIRADDFRELCEDDGELGETLLDSLAAMIARRRPRASSPVDARGSTDPQLPAVPREASDAYYTGGDLGTFDDPDDDPDARDRAATIPDEPTERKLPPRQRHIESSVIAPAAPRQSAAQPPTRPSPPAPLPLPEPPAAAQPPTQVARRTVPPPPPQPSRSGAATTPPTRPSPPPDFATRATQPTLPLPERTRAARPTPPPSEPDSRPSPPSLPPPTEVASRATPPSAPSPERASRVARPTPPPPEPMSRASPSGPSAERASRTARPTPPPPEPMSRASPSAGSPPEAGSRAASPSASPPEAGSRAASPSAGSPPEAGSRAASPSAPPPERVSRAARPTPPPAPLPTRPSSPPASRPSSSSVPPASRPAASPAQPPARPSPPPAQRPAGPRPSAPSDPRGTRPSARPPSHPPTRPSPPPAPVHGAPAASRATPTPAQAQAAAALLHRATPARGVPREQTPGQGVPRASSPAQGVPRTPIVAASPPAGGEPGKPVATSSAAPAARSGSWAATTPRVRGESPWDPQNPGRRSDPALDRSTGSPPRGFARALTPSAAKPRPATPVPGTPRGAAEELRTPSDPEIETYLELEADLPPEPGIARDYEPELALRRALDDLEDHDSVSITIEQEGHRVIETVTEMDGHTLTVTVTEPYAFDERQRAITAEDGHEVSGTISIPEDTPPPLPPRRRVRRQSEGWDD